MILHGIRMPMSGDLKVVSLTHLYNDLRVVIPAKAVKSLPKELRGSLPTIEELEKELGGTEETKR